MGSALSGRHTLLTPQLIEIMASCIALGMSNKDATKAVGISEFSYYGWMKIAEEEQLNREIGIVDPSKDMFLQFSKSIEEARAKGQRALLQRVYKAAFGPTKQTVKKKEVDGNGNVIRETTTETVSDGDPKYATWILERRWRGEYAKHTIQHKIDWQDNVKQLLEQGSLSKEDLAAEIGEELAQTLFENDDLKQLGDGNIESTQEDDGRRSMGDDEGGTTRQTETERTRGKTETSSPRIIDVAPDIQE